MVVTARLLAKLSSSSGSPFAAKRPVCWSNSSGSPCCETTRLLVKFFWFALLRNDPSAGQILLVVAASCLQLQLSRLLLKLPFFNNIGGRLYFIFNDAMPVTALCCQVGLFQGTLLFVSALRRLLDFSLFVRGDEGCVMTLFCMSNPTNKQIHYFYECGD